MCEWIKSASLHPRYAEERMCGAGHTCKVQSEKVMKTIGWVILDKHDVVYEFVSKSRHFFGAIVENEAPSTEYLDIISKDWAGLAPFTVREIYS